MKTMLFILLAGLGLSVQAQTPPAPTKEQAAQMQQMMAMRMQMMAALYDLKTSRLGLDATVAAIRAAGEKRGWKVGETVDMQEQMRKAGAKDAKRMKVVNLCPQGANEKVAKASDGKAPPLPCRATVFEGADGKVNVVRMNLHALAKGMQGDLAKTLADLAQEDDALYKGILE